VSLLLTGCRLVLPWLMFGVAASFLTLVAAHDEDGLVWAYALVMAVLTSLNLWSERAARR